VAVSFARLVFSCFEVIYLSFKLILWPHGYHVHHVERKVHTFNADMLTGNRISALVQQLVYPCDLTLIVLTYDDVRVARASTGIYCEVSLDLISSLIEQVQVVLHWVSIMKALAQTDDT